MSDDTPTEARPASGEHDTNTAPAETAGNTSESTKQPSGDGRGSAAGGAPRRRRRRGSRGGRNRRKPKSAAAPEGAAAAADRGMTTEDVAAARVEAGLAEAEPGAVTAADAPSSTKPKIGDTRPAPPSGDGTPTRKRRRRRGGRGRGRGRTPGGGTDATTAPDAVRADTGAAGAAVSLDELDDTALERRRGRTRKGRPAGRYMMSVHVREDRTTHIGVLEGRSLVEHYVGSLEPDDTAIDGNIYLGRVQNVLPGMEAAFIDIGTPKNGVLYRGDVAYDPGDVEGGEKPR